MKVSDLLSAGRREGSGGFLGSIASSSECKISNRRSPIRGLNSGDARVGFWRCTKNRVLVLPQWPSTSMAFLNLPKRVLLLSYSNTK